MHNWKKETTLNPLLRELRFGPVLNPPGIARRTPAAPERPIHPPLRKENR